MQSPIIDKADTAERLSKNAFLLVSRIEPGLVCSFRLAHRLFAFLMFLDMLFHGRQNLPIERAIVAALQSLAIVPTLERETGL